MSPGGLCLPLIFSSMAVLCRSLGATFCLLCLLCLSEAFVDKTRLENMKKDLIRFLQAHKNAKEDYDDILTFRAKLMKEYQNIINLLKGLNRKFKISKILPSFEGVIESLETLVDEANVLTDDMIEFLETELQKNEKLFRVYEKYMDFLNGNIAEL